MAEVGEVAGSLRWAHVERGLSLFAAGEPLEESACDFGDSEHVTRARSDATVTKFNLVSYACVDYCHPSRCVGLSSIYIERLWLSKV